MSNKNYLFGQDIDANWESLFFWAFWHIICIFLNCGSKDIEFQSFNSISVFKTISENRAETFFTGPVLALEADGWVTGQVSSHVGAKAHGQVWPWRGRDRRGARVVTTDGGDHDSSDGAREGMIHGAH